MDQRGHALRGAVWGLRFALVPAAMLAAQLSPAQSQFETRNGSTGWEELQNLNRAYGDASVSDISELRTLAGRVGALLKGRMLTAEQHPLAELLLAQIERDRVAAGDLAAHASGIGAARRAIAGLPARQTDALASAWMTLGQLLTMPPSAAAQADLRLGIQAYSEALRLSAGDIESQRIALFNRATASIFLAGADAAPGIDQAIKDFEGLLGNPAFAKNEDRAALTAFNLGGAYLNRLTGDLTENAEKAIGYYQRALAATDRTANPLLWAQRARSLAEAFSGARLEQPARMDMAEQQLRDAADIYAKASRPADQFRALFSLAELQRRRAPWTGTDDLVAARTTLAKARSLLSGDDHAMLLRSAEAELLSSERELGNRSVTVEAVVDAWRRALATADRQAAPRAWAALQNNLGNACNAVDRPNLERCALDAYKAALSVRTREGMPLEHFDTLANLGQLYFRHGHWAEAAEAAMTLTGVSDEISSTLSTHALRGDQAGRSDRWYENGAYALARLGRSSEAYEMLERGRARTARQLVQTRAGLVRSAPPTDIPVVAPLITLHGTVVFYHLRGRVRVAFLDGLKGAAVAARISNRDEASPGWLQQYDLAHDVEDPDAATRRTMWIKEVASMADWLGEQLVQPVLAELEKGGIPASQPIVWSVQGELAILPLSAATLADGLPLAAHRSSWLVPSEIFLGATGSAPRPPILTVANPTRDPALALADLESWSAQRSAGTGAETLESAKASSTTLIEMFGRSRVFHFAGHAWHDADDPAKSFLQAQDGPLTLGSILDARVARAPELVVLSACESGRVHVNETGNEFQGLPMGFLAAGSGGVVSTLWPVNDVVAFFLMDEFFRQLFGQGLSPPAALTVAQAWLRDATARDLARRAEAIRASAPPGAHELDRVIAALEPMGDEHPFMAAAFWSGFYYTGAASPRATHEG